MLKYLFLFPFFQLSIVTSSEQIFSDIYIGMPEEAVFEYFSSLDDVEGPYWLDVDTGGSVSHEIREGEKGYWLFGLKNFRRKWWLPSFGGVLTVLVVISDEGTVTNVKTFGASGAWP